MWIPSKRLRRYGDIVMDEFTLIGLLSEALYCEGGHHKQWYIEQALENVMGTKRYNTFKKKLEEVEVDDGEEEYPWEKGIPP